MRIFNILIGLLICQIVCNGQETRKEIKMNNIIASKNVVFGKKIDVDGAITAKDMVKKYSNLSVNDTITVKFRAQVLEVCQAKGCWMKLQLENGKEAMVRFKDYGFFVPKDLAGKEVIVSGLAFVEEMNVDDRRHYARDAGKSKEEIASIIESKRTYGFEAEGILLKD